MTEDGNIIEKIIEFSCLGDALSSGEIVQETVSARMRSRWKKFKNVECVRCKRVVSLTLRQSLYNSCVRSALCYGAECWALEKEDKKNYKLVK